MNMKLPLKVRVFGRFCVQRNGVTVAGFEAGKLQEIFTYLLLHRHAPQSRDTLAELCWAEQTAAQSKKHLRQALWQIQTALNAQLNGDHERILEVEAEWVGIALGADIWVDVTTFEETFKLIQGVPGNSLDEEQARAVGAAVELYQGDLLSGCYKDWCLFERERMKNLLLTMLNKLTDYYARQGQFELGIAYGTRILACDRARENAYRKLMRLHYLSGDRTGALRVYRNCVEALKEELGVEPSVLTVKLYQQLCADRLDNNEARADSVHTTELVSHLKEACQCLSQVQKNLESCLEYVEKKLKKQL